MLLRGVAMVTMATDFKDMKNPLPRLRVYASQNG